MIFFQILVWEMLLQKQVDVPQPLSPSPSVSDQRATGSRIALVEWGGNEINLRVCFSLCVCDCVCVHYKGEGELHWLVKVLPLWQRTCDKTFQPLSGPWRRPWENNTCVECCRLHKNWSCGVHKKNTHAHIRQTNKLAGRAVILSHLCVVKLLSPTAGYFLLVELLKSAGSQGCSCMEAPCVATINRSHSVWYSLCFLSWGLKYVQGLQTLAWRSRPTQQFLHHSGTEQHSVFFFLK